MDGGGPERTVLVEAVPSECSLGKLKSLLKAKTKVKCARLKFLDTNVEVGDTRNVVAYLESDKG